MSKDEDDEERAKKIIEAGDIFDKKYTKRTMSNNDDNDNDDVILNREPLFGPEYQRRRDALSDDAPECQNSKEKAIAWVDKRYIISTADGPFRILSERVPNELHFMTKKDFIDSLAPYKIHTLSDNNKPTSISYSQLWLEWIYHREVNRIVFDPNPAVKRGYDGDTQTYNTFRGFATKPIKGDVRPYLRFWRNVICSGNHANFRWYVAYVAQMFQQPHIKMGTSVVQRGGEGIGKSKHVETLGELMSGKKRERVNDYYFKASNPEHVTGKWNDHLTHCILLLLEETFYAGDLRGAHIIRDLTSSEEAPAAQRYMSTKIMQNYIRPFFNGNEEWLIHAASDSRRPFVIDVSEKYKNDENYYVKLGEWLDNGGREALMYFLMNFNFTKYNLRTAPVTEALISQREYTMKNDESWWLDSIWSGQLPFYGREREFDGSARVVKEVLFDKFSAALRRNVTKNRSSETKFGNLMRKLIPNIKNGKIVEGSPITVVKVGPMGAQKYAYLIPPLKYCREAMDIRLGMKRQWEEPLEWEKAESQIDKYLHGEM